LYRDFQIKITNLFDTQLACRFLGLNETSLDAVLAKRFSIHLDKKNQKKDWSQRPLSEEMMAYAANDVLFLVQLGKTLEKELEEKGRLSWVHEENQLLSKARPSSANTDPLFFRFKGAGRMVPRELAILETVLRYRKTMAQKKDRPVFKILGNSSIFKLVKARPLDLSQLEETQALSRKQIHMYGNDLLKKIQDALAIPDGALPSYPRKKAPIVKAAVRKRIKALKSWRDRKAEMFAIDPALVCSKGLIADISGANPDTLSRLGQIKELKNWQKRTYGQEILTVLREANGRKN
jgi:ribonuclease D